MRWSHGDTRIQKLSRKPIDPGVELAEAEPGQAGRVSSGVPGDEDADGGWDTDSSAMSKDPADQDPSDAAVAVPVGVDGLELGMGDCRLGDRVHPGGVHEADEVDHEVLDPLGWGRNEGGAAR